MQTVRSDLRVLVVEDDPASAIFIRAIVDKEGFPCDVAGNGHEAMAVMAEQRIDLVITDLQMDGMDGHRLLDYLGEHHPLIPKIVLTASSTLITMLDCLRQGALAFCTKPLGDGGELKEALSIALHLIQHRREQLQKLVRMNRQSKADSHE